MTDFVALSVGVAVGCTFLAVALLAFRHRDRPGAVPFVALTALLAGMTGSVTLGRMGVIAGIWVDFGVFVPLVFALLAWVVLAFEYTGRGPVMTARRTAAVAGFGVAVLGITALIYVMPEHLVPVYAVLVNIFQMTLLAAAGYGAFLVARSAIGYGDIPRSGNLVLTIAGGGIFVATAIVALIPFVPYGTALDALQALLAATAALFLLTQIHYRVFETGPSAGHLARETVLDEMSASAAITNREDRLLDLNRTAEHTFDVEGPGPLGEPIESVLGIDTDRRLEDPVAVETVEGRRQVEVERFPLAGRGGESIGWAYLLRDVTDRRTHEQQLDVLNRVLRHNLRNDLDAIRGFAEALERDQNVETAAVAERIHATATDLSELGTTITLAERLLAGDRLEYDPVDAVALARSVAADVDEAAPDATVTVSPAEPSLEIRTDRRVLESILEEVVGNAVEHCDAADPRVELAVRSEGASAIIDVRDNGPGIPRRERAVLLEGREEPLRHGSGLGLWLVSWGVTRLGGDLSFRENEPRGSVVSVRIPDR